MSRFILILIFSLSGQCVGAKIDFLPKFEESRARFKSSCLGETQAVFCKEFKIASGRDPDLSVDVGYFGGSGHHLIVIQSGVHGPETPAGAAIQQLFTEKYLHTFLSKGIDVLLVHAVNPYGFKYSRRVDENNIDLNRNFTLNSDLYQTKNGDYMKVKSVIEREGPVIGIGLEETRIEAGLIMKYAVSGFNRSRVNSIIGGQYESPRGLFYGGNSPAEQVKILFDLYRGLFAKYDQILMLDVHTGLGDRGILNIIPSPKSNFEKLNEVVNTFSGLKSEGVKTVDYAMDKKFYAPTGDTVDFVAQLAPKDACVTALTLEFGTLGSNIVRELESASRLIIENQAHFYGCRNDHICAQAKRAFLDMFNPDDQEWQNAVLYRADLLFEALAR